MSFGSTLLCGPIRPGVATSQVACLFYLGLAIGLAVEAWLQPIDSGLRLSQPVGFALAAAALFLSGGSLGLARKIHFARREAAIPHRSPASTK